MRIHQLPFSFSSERKERLPSKTKKVEKGRTSEPERAGNLCDHHLVMVWTTLLKDSENTRGNGETKEKEEEEE